MELIVEKHQRYVQNELENENGFSHPELYELFGLPAEDYQKGCRCWKRRYNTLRQDTQFFKNIVSLYNLRWFNCMNEDMWHLKLDLHNVPQEVADFEIVYSWMDPWKWYAYDWRRLEHANNAYPMPYFESIEEMHSWQILRNRFKKIVKEHLPICSVNDFSSFSID